VDGPEGTAMILDSVIGRLRNSTYRNPEPWFLEWFYGGQQSDSGIIVNPANALTYAPYWECIAFISGDLGKIPYPVLKRTAQGRERDTKHPAYRLMMYEANDLMTADVFRETIQAHALGWGNGRAWIVRDRMQKPSALIPFLPHRTKTLLQDGQKWHVVKMGETEEEKTFPDRDVLHIAGMGYDGINGYSIAAMARQSIGRGMAEEKHGARLFKNYAVPPIILQTDQRLTEPVAKQLLSDWEKHHAGSENAGKAGLLHSGTKAQQLTAMPNKDAQWLESRKFSRAEIAGWFKMPPSKIGGDDQINYNSLEHFALAYLEGCILYWEVRWQLECRRKLLFEREKEADSHYFEFFNDALVTVDFASKVEALNKLIAAEIFNSNEAREKLNMNHRPGGDVYRNPNTKTDESKPETKPEPAKKPPSKAAIVDYLVKNYSAELRGQAGPQGEPGMKGDPGEQGPMGPQGIAGERGPQGEQGIAGAEGPQGLAGPQGITGETGPQGEIGPIGPAGPEGPQGLSGGIGPEGPQGSTGPRGEIGERGSDGLQGPAGESGPAGPQGIRGEAGERGERGPQGEEGKPSLYGRCLDTLSEAIAQEVAIVRHHATSAKNFTGWIETWYPKRILSFCVLIKRLGADEVLAVEHCDESRSQLMALTEQTTMEKLATDVQALTGAWHDRAVSLARRIAGGDKPNLPVDPGTMVSTPGGLGTVASIESDWRYQVECGGSTVELSEKDIEVIG
jgi:HK97 family phage portal protein